MNVSVKLYGTLRDKLPREQKGRAVMELSADTTIRDLLAQLNIANTANVSLNDQHKIDLNQSLKEGDRLIIFTHAAGG